MTAAKKMVEKTTKELQREDPEFLPTVYGMKKASLSKLKKEYDPATMPVSVVKGDEGYEIIHKKAMALVKVRTNIDKKRKELIEDANSWRNHVNGEAKKYTEIVVSLEKPWKDKKAELDNAAEMKAENERLAELERTEAIEDRVNAILAVTANLVGADANELSERLNLVNTMIVDESFDEYQDTANEHKDNAIQSLTKAIADRKDFEAQQEEIAKGKAELAAARLEIEKLKGLTTPEEPIKTTADYVVDQASELNHEDVGVNAEHPSSFGGTANVQSEDVTPYIDLTEKQMVKVYMQNLLDVDVPDVGSEEMLHLVGVISGNLAKLNRFILVNTQEV